MSSGAHLLVVEDNYDMRYGLEQFFLSNGYQVTAVASCEDAIDVFDEQKLQCAVVDINLPGKSGFSLVEHIRETDTDLPLIAMTARDGIDDKLKGFDLGLTDYIVKPFNLRELLARVKTHTKGVTDENIVKTPRFKVNMGALEFYDSKKRLSLTSLELKIMHVLMQNNHQLVQLDDLIEYVWGESDDLVTPPVRIHIANIRKKIGDKKYEIIRTIPGTGYIFNDPIEERAG